MTSEETHMEHSRDGQAFIQRLAEAKDAFSSAEGSIEPELREELWRVSNEFGVTAEFYTLDFAMVHFPPAFRVYAWRQFMETSLLRLEINSLKAVLNAGEPDTLQGQLERGMREAERRRREASRAESIARHPSSMSGIPKQQNI